MTLKLKIKCVGLSWNVCSCTLQVSTSIQLFAIICFLIKGLEEVNIMGAEHGVFIRTSVGCNGREPTTKMMQLRYFGCPYFCSIKYYFNSKLDDALTVQARS